jgi:predicted  nucleic acid-binding Zn-ribbon protein
MEFSERLKGERDEAKDEIVIIQNEVHKLSDYIKSNQDQRKAEILEAERLKNKFNEMEKNFEKSVQCMEDVFFSV